MKLNSFLKGFILGFTLGALYMSSPSDKLNAKVVSMDTERGAVEWNPVFVKIVK